MNYRFTRRAGLALTGMVFAAGIAWATNIAWAETAEEKGLRIMQGVDALPVIEKAIQLNELRIYDKQDKILFVKKLRSASFYKDYANSATRLSRSINYFYAPADDKGNGTLTIEIADSDDDEQYLYLKQTRKIRRIIGSSKSDDFMGSDFTLGDIAPRDVDDFEFKWLGTKAIPFKNASIETEMIQTVFKSSKKRNDYNEGKAVIWVHPASGIVFQAERYDTTMQLSRRTNVRNIAKGKNRDGKAVYYPTRIVTTNLNRGTRSEFIVKSRKNEGQANISASIFTKDFLTRKWW